jgi:hypothetical protein
MNSGLGLSQYTETLFPMKVRFSFKVAGFAGLHFSSIAILLYTFVV